MAGEETLMTTQVLTNAGNPELATPVYTRSMPSLIMGMRILLTTNPGASATSTAYLPIAAVSSAMVL